MLLRKKIKKVFFEVITTIVAFDTSKYNTVVTENLMAKAFSSFTRQVNTGSAVLHDDSHVLVYVTSK